MLEMKVLHTTEVVEVVAVDQADTDQTVQEMLMEIIHKRLPDTELPQ
jgi:hypothetical protein